MSDQPYDIPKPEPDITYADWLRQCMLLDDSDAGLDDGGAIRVQPILQQPRPLHGRQALCQPVAATPVRTLQYA